MVLAAELLADLGQGQICQFAAQVHGQLASMRNGARLAGAGEPIHRNTEILRSYFLDGGGSNSDVAFIRKNVAQCNLGNLKRDRLIDQGGVCRHPDQCAFELTNGGLELGGDEGEHIVADLGAVGGSLLHQDGNTRFQVWRLNIRDQPALKARTQAIFQRGQLTRRTVGGQNDLLIRLVQSVEGVEELLLGTFLTLQELDVIHHEDVQVAVPALERFLPVIAHGVDVVIREFFRRHIFNTQIRLQHAGVVASRVEQVRLAQAGAAPNEQRVVRTGGGFRHCDSRTVGKAVGGTNNKILKRVLRVQRRLTVRIHRRLLTRNTLRSRHDRVRRLLAGRLLHQVLLLLRVNSGELIKAHRQLFAGDWCGGCGRYSRLWCCRSCRLLLPRRLRVGGVPLASGLALGLGGLSWLDWFCWLWCLFRRRTCRNCHGQGARDAHALAEKFTDVWGQAGFHHVLGGGVWGGQNAVALTENHRVAEL